MKSIDEFYKEFLDSLELDIDFDSDIKQFKISTADTTYSEAVELPTLTQLINQKSNEFMQAILVDIGPRIVVEFEDLSIFDESVEYSTSIAFLTNVELSDVNIIQFLLGKDTLEITESDVQQLVEFCESNNFTKKESLTGPYGTYEYNIKAVNDLNAMLNELYKFIESHKTVRSLDDLRESIISSFKKFNRT